MKKIILILITLILLSACTQKKEENNNITTVDNKNLIVLNTNSATLNGLPIKEYDYKRSINRDTEEEVFTGTSPDENDSIYIAHDIVYYPEIEESEFVKEEYDGEIEWVCHYSNENLKQYIFSTLPVLGESLPKEMMHSEQEAYNNPVLHICEPGEYTLEGNWHGQIWIDLKEDAFYDETQKVTIVLNGVDVICDVAPALVFYNVFEADCNWEEREEYSNVVDIKNAGAKVIITDGTENNFTGANVYRLLKPVYKKEDSDVQKKRWKMDGAFYSYESLLIESSGNGTGILNITSTTFEGLNSELHLTINSGYINIVSQDDGINVNEDDVSIFTMNNGRLTIFAGQGAEGDVLDSNGYITINGGTILGTTPSNPDEILDSEKGVEISEKALIISGGSPKNNMPMGEKPKEMFDRETKEGRPQPPEWDVEWVPRTPQELPNNAPEQNNQ